MTENSYFSNRYFISVLKTKTCDLVIKPTTSVRNLGAILDSHLDMEHHVNSVCRSCHLQIRHIGKIRQYITETLALSLVNSLVTSRLDYCNSLLFGCSKSVINKLQLVQNTAARLITEHITPTLKKLHWLPVSCRIEYKMLTLVYKALHGQSPGYISDMLEMYTPTRLLRSQQDATLFVVPKTRTATYGDRSFASAAPRLWNGLPLNVQDCATLQMFKKSLKTFYFRKHYGA